MAVAFDAVGTVFQPSSTTDDTTLTIGAGANRALSVIVVAFAPSAPTVTVTWDQGGTNQALTQVALINDPTSNVWAAVYGLVAPTSGNKTLRITGIDGLSTTANVIALSWTGVLQTSAAAAFTNANTATGNSTTPSVSVTSAVSNAVVAGHGTGGGTFSATNNTQLFVAANGAANRAAGAASVSMTATLPSAVTWASVGVNIVQTAAATLPGWMSLPNRIPQPSSTFFAQGLTQAPLGPPAVPQMGWFQELSLPLPGLPPTTSSGAVLPPSPPVVILNTIGSVAWIQPLSRPAAALPPTLGGVTWAPFAPTQVFNTTTQVGWLRPLSPPAPALPPTLGGVTWTLTFTPSVANTIGSIAWTQPLSPPAQALPATVGGALLPPFPYVQGQPAGLVPLGWFWPLSAPAAALPPWTGGPALTLSPTPTVANTITGLGWFQALSRPARELPPWKGGAVWSNFLPPYLNTINSIAWLQNLSPPAQALPIIVVPPQFLSPIILPEVPPPPIPPVQAFGGSGYASSRTGWRSRGVRPGMPRYEMERIAATLAEVERKQMLMEIDDDDIAFLLMNMDNLS